MSNDGSGIATGTDVELWRLPNVLAAAGLSKSEVYRRMKDTDPALNPFPPSRRRPGPGQGVFWVSVDVRAWQLAEMGVAPPPFPDWPSALLARKPAPALANPSGSD